MEELTLMNKLALIAMGIGAAGFYGIWKDNGWAGLFILMIWISMLLMFKILIKTIGG